MTFRGCGVAAVLEKARAGMSRLTPQEAAEASGASPSTLLIDTRTEAQRRDQGELPGAIVIDRTVLEWRLDPSSGASIPEATGYDLEIIVVCRRGYSSRLAAASLRAVGLWRATDMIDGVEGWIAAGLPLTDGAADVRT